MAKVIASIATFGCIRKMASTKAKVGIINESNSIRESAKTCASSPMLLAEAASLTLNNRTYSLDDLDTISTVGKFRQQDSML